MKVGINRKTKRILEIDRTEEYIADSTEVPKDYNIEADLPGMRGSFRQIPSIDLKILFVKKRTRLMIQCVSLIDF